MTPDLRLIESWYDIGRIDALEGAIETWDHPDLEGMTPIEKLVAMLDVARDQSGLFG